MLDQWITGLRALGRSERTIERREMTARRFAEWLGGEQAMLTARPVDIDGWLNTLTIAPVSRGYYMSDLAAFYEWAIEVELCDVDPVARMRKPKRPTYLPKPIPTPYLEEALAHASDSLYPRLVLGAFAGLRASEIAAAHSDHVEGGQLRVVGKGLKTRLVPLHPRVESVIGGGPIAGSRGRHVTRKHVTESVAGFLRSLGFDYTCHSLRHWFGTEAYRVCKDLRVVQELMGHSSPVTTAGYTRHDAELAVAAVRGLDLRAA